MPVAPARLSTTMGLPSRSLQGVPTMRAMRSFGPPGAEATIRRIGRIGYCDSAAETIGAGPSPVTTAHISHEVFNVMPAPPSVAARVRIDVAHDVEQGLPLLHQ